MQIRTSINIDAPAMESWRVLGEQFGAVADWSASLCSSSLEGELGVGAVRSCEGVGFGPFPPGVVTEELTRYDPHAMSFTYQGTSGMPWFILSAQNAWSIESVSDHQSLVTSDAAVELIWWLRPLGFLMPVLLRRDMARFTEELKYRIEQGRPHPRAMDSVTGEAGG